MRNTHIPLDMKSLEVISQCIDKEGNIVFEVRGKKHQSICHKCGKSAIKSNGRAPMRRVRYLPIFDQPVYLEIHPIRYSCEHCGNGTTTTEQYEWVDRNATINKGLDDYIMRSLIYSTIQDVSKKNELATRLFRQY